MIQTRRLELRRWKDSDLDPFAALCADEQVMEFFPGTLNREQSADFMARARQHFADHGYGLWALECLAGPPFIGFVGLSRVRFAAPFTPAVEIGWRLARPTWGQGYASEASRAVLRYAFETLDLPEVVSFTVPANTRSRGVMERIGMGRDPSEDFDHPALPEGHPLNRHVLYRLTARDWKSRASPDESA